MNPDLYVFALIAIGSLAPGRDHTRLAAAIADAVESEEPLFKDDADKKLTAATLVAIAMEESNFRLDAVGDEGTSFCALQISNGVGGSLAMLTDAGACVVGAMRVLRWSVRFCARFPLAGYASGLNGCRNPRAQEISTRRLTIARHLVTKVVPTIMSANSWNPSPFLPLTAASIRASFGPRPECTMHAFSDGAAR